MSEIVPLSNLEGSKSVAFQGVQFNFKGKINNILGINPASVNQDRLPIPPLGILYIAAYTRKHGYDQWRIVDNDVIENRPVEGFREDIAWADIVALTGTTAQAKQAMQIAALAKSMGKLVVFGGPHATPTWKETLEMSDVDIIARGEGEVTFLELLNALREGRSLYTVDGLAFRDANGVPVKTKPRYRNFSLDEIPFPARDLVPVEEYGNKPLVRFSTDERYAHLIMTRGCTDKCEFCNTPNNWGGPVARSAGNLFAEMMHVYEKYGIKYFHFQDDVFTVNQEIVRALCYLLIEVKLRKQKNIPFEWSCLVRPDQVNYELLCLMKLAGCVQVEMGVESGSEDLLKTARKRYTKTIIKQGVEAAHRAGILVYAFFIVGLPGETMDTWRQTVRFAKELNPDGSVWTVLTPYPGTDIYEKREMFEKQNIMKILNPDWTSWLYKTPVVQIGDLTPDILLRLRNIANRVVNGPSFKGAYRLEAIEYDKITAKKKIIPKEKV